MEKLTKQLILQDLIDHEGCVTWLYCDTRGLVTIGIGNLVKMASDAEALPLSHGDTGLEATSEEKRQAHRAVMTAFRDGRPAIYYAEVSDLRITKEFAHELLNQRLEGAFLPALRRRFPEFDQWPQQAQRVAVDMIYSLGERGLVERFPHFVHACRIQDWGLAAQHCTRASGRTPDGGLGRRNLWALFMFKELTQ
jgi:GH24 family phage-related lysozyme (muramidase)